MRLSQHQEGWQRAPQLHCLLRSPGRRLRRQPWHGCWWKWLRQGGRKLAYATKVQFNGNLMVGKAYTAMLDLQPGDEFEIKLGKKQIRLVPVGGSDEEE